MRKIGYKGDVMNKGNPKPAYESLVDLLEGILRDLPGDSPLTADQGSYTTATEIALLSIVDTKIPGKHKQEVVDRLRALADEHKDSTPLIYLALVGLVWTVEQSDEEATTPPDA